MGGTDDLFERLRWVGIGVACVGLTCADATPAPPILLPCSRASMNDMLGDCFYRQPSVQTRHSFHSAKGKCEKTICRGGEFFREKKSGDFFPRALFSLDGESGFALVGIWTNQNAASPFIRVINPQPFGTQWSPNQPLDHPVRIRAALKRPPVADSLAPHAR